MVVELQTHLSTGKSHPLSYNLGQWLLNNQELDILNHKYSTVPTEKKKHEVIMGNKTTKGLNLTENGCLKLHDLGLQRL